MTAPPRAARTLPRRLFEALRAAWGPQHWWPGDGPVEMIVGAILTQNTAWTNVERALARLRVEGAIDFAVLHAVPADRLSRWIRPAGTFRLKTRRLKAFAAVVANRHGGSIDAMLAQETSALRTELLAIPGIGPETADSILLYAGGRPVFVADDYARRLLERHGWIALGAPYESVAAFFTSRLPADASLFNEFHALIVRLGKAHCRATPRCTGCPLRPWLPGRTPARATQRGRSRCGRAGRAVAVALLAGTVAAGPGCRTSPSPARRVTSGDPATPRRPAPQGRVIRVQPGSGYVILDLDVVPPPGTRLSLVRGAEAVAVIRLLPERRGHWGVADIESGTPRIGDMVGPVLEKEKQP